MYLRDACVRYGTWLNTEEGHKPLPVREALLKKQGKTPPSLTHLPSRIHSRSHCPPHAPPLVRSTAVGAAYGTARSGTGVATAGIMHPDAVMKSIIPVVMAGIIAIYGLVVAVLIGNGMADATQYSLFKGFLDLGSGLAVGIAGLAAGYAIGVVGDTGVRGTGMQPKVIPHQSTPTPSFHGPSRDAMLAAAWHCDLPQFRPCGSCGRPRLPPACSWRGPHLPRDAVCHGPPSGPFKPFPARPQR